jgi:membrane-associated phospholipid phosphatase
MDLMFLATIISNLIYEIEFVTIYNFVKDRSKDNFMRLIKLILCIMSVYLMQKYEPHNWLTLRPENGSGCLFEDSGDKDYLFKTGFPSGHAATTTLFCAYNIKNNLNNIPLVIFNIFLILIIAWSRWYKNCHTVIQLVAGILYGLFLTVL